MSLLSTSIVWCVLQVTLVSLAAWLLCLLAGPSRARHDSLVPTTALISVLALTVLAFVPLPASWNYGLRWDLASSQEIALAPPDAAPLDQPGVDTAVLKGTPHPAVGTVSEHLGKQSGLNLPETLVEVLQSPQAAPSETAVTATPAIPQSAVATTGRGWNWGSVILMGLSIWVLLGLLQLTGGLIAARAYRRSSRLVQDTELSELIDVLCAELKCTAKIELRETSSLATAATIGWRQPLILLPLEWRGWTVAQQRAVLAHEIAHVARYDFLACVLAQLSVSLHFYHPLVHWLARRLRLEQELAADALAATVAGGERDYLHSLAELALRQSERPLGWPARTFLPTRGTFMRRIEMLRDAQQGRAGRQRIWPRWMAVGMLMAGTIAVTGLRETEVPGSAQAAAQEQKEEKPTQPAVGKTTGAPAATESDSVVNVAYIPNDSVLFAAIRPRELAKNPQVADIFTQLDKSLLHLKAEGISIAQLEQLTIVLYTAGGITMDLLLVETSEPIDFAKLAKLTVGHGTDVPAYQSQTTGPAFAKMGDKAAVIAVAPHISAYLTCTRGEPVVAGTAAWKKVQNRPIAAGIDMRLLRVSPQFGIDASTPQFSPFAPFFEETESIVFGASVEKDLQLRVVAECLGLKGAEQVYDSAMAGAITARNILRAQRNARNIHAAQNIGAPGVSEPPYLRILFDAVDKSLSNVKVGREELLVTAEARMDLTVRGVSTLGSLIPNAIDAQKASNKAVMMNNARQIMLAMHNYLDTFQTFPAAAGYGSSQKDKYPSSWRVQLLPFLGHAKLWNAYQFDEPWDSESNKKILEQMPAVYRMPGAPANSTTTAFFVVIGQSADASKEVNRRTPPATPVAPGAPQTIDPKLATLFSKDGGRTGLSIQAVTDGTSNTIAIVEAKRDVPWTKPEDVTFDPSGKLPLLGGYFPGEFLVGISDGSVRFFPSGIAQDRLKAYLTPSASDSTEEVPTTSVVK